MRLLYPCANHLEKQHLAISRGAYHRGHEPCWYAVRKGKTSQSTVWEVANPNPFGGSAGKGEDGITGHGTQKPVEIMRRPILNHTRRGEAVYDLFPGSGTTLIAAESTGRICYGIDIDPRYVDIAVMRWQNSSGKRDPPRRWAWFRTNIFGPSEGDAMNQMLPPGDCGARGPDPRWASGVARVVPGIGGLAGIFLAQCAADESADTMPAGSYR
jgi:hypothetical protein